MAESVTIEEALALIRAEYEKVDKDRVFWSVRMMRAKHFQATTYDLLTWCIAVHNCGLRITCKLISALIGDPITALIGRLHLLGDRKFLTLVRKSSGMGTGARCEWVLSSYFKKVFFGKLEEVKT